MSYFSGRGDYSTSTFNDSSNPFNKLNKGEKRNMGKSGSPFMEANGRIESAVEKKKKAYDDAAAAIAAYAVASNQNGAANTKAISEELSKLLREFTDSEKVMILTKAIGAMIVNM